MTIPPYRFFIDPLIKYLAGHESSVRASEAHEAVADILNLTTQERATETSTGMKTYRNRTSWAFNTIKHTGLAHSPADGLWELSSAGRAFARTHPRLSPEEARRLVAKVKRSSSSDTSASLSVTATVSAPSVVGDKKAYRLAARPFASGGQADVYEAVRKRDNKTVIFKRAKNFMTTKRMCREIEIQRLLEHINIMPILDWDVANSAWYVMPRGVRTMIDLAPPVEPQLLLSILRDVAAALEYSHLKGHPHRDVKPHNIIELVDRGVRRWVLADWGLTRRALGETTFALTKSGAFGTEGYAAPESYRDAHELGAPGDIYSLGQVAAWATGVTPIPNVAPSVAAPWGQLIEPMTRLVSEERLQEISEVVRLLDELEAALGVWASE